MNAFLQDKIEGAAGANDSTIALRSWQRHKEIHNSIVVDLFQGQYRSQLVCPLCHRLSVTFDPFLNLSLPLPHAASLRFNVAGNFEVSKAFAAEMQVKLPLSQAKAKDLALVGRTRGVEGLFCCFVGIPLWWMLFTLQPRSNVLVAKANKREEFFFVFTAALARGYER